MKLFIPGVAEYAACKKDFELAEQLLEASEVDQDKLLEILHTLGGSPDAVNFLEAQFGQRYRQVHGRLAEACSRTLFDKTFTLDSTPADNGTKKTQDQWFDYWQNINDGKVMASMGDLYASFKLLKNQIEKGTVAEKTQAEVLLVGLKEDFDWSRQSNWLISSTRLKYEADSLEATITQHYRSNNPELIKETTLHLPAYSGTPIAQVADKKLGQNYLGVLFNTEDDPETICKLWNSLAKSPEIIFWSGLPLKVLEEAILIGRPGSAITMVTSMSMAATT